MAGPVAVQAESSQASTNQQSLYFTVCLQHNRSARALGYHKFNFKWDAGERGGRESFCYFNLSRGNGSTAIAAGGGERLHLQ